MALEAQTRERRIVDAEAAGAVNGDRRAPAKSPAGKPLPPFVVTILKTLPSFSFPVAFLWRLGQRWATDRCAVVSAALAFFGLISIFPLVLAAVAIVSRLVASTPQTLDAFHVFIAGFFPGAAGEITRQIDAVARSSNTATLGLIATTSLLWSGRAYFATLASIFDSIWPHARPRPFWHNQLALWSLFGGAGLLWLLSTLATFTLRTAQAMALSSPDLFINKHPAIWNISGNFISFVLTTWMFWLLYRFLPNVETQKRRKLVWGASFVGGLGWEGAKWLFTVVIGANMGHYQATYGSAAGVVVTLVWIYLSSSILLLGAEAAAVYEEMDAADAKGLWFKRRKGDA